jgi:hypothetical protein
MANRDNRGSNFDPATWPFPAGAWVMMLFWLVVVALAVASWLFG